MAPITPHPGDVLAFWRKPLGYRGAWLEAKYRRARGASWPFAILGAVAAVTVSWRIQKATTTQHLEARGLVAPNHVAVYVGGGEIVEAEYDRGVTSGVLRTRYPSDRFHWVVCHFPGNRYERSVVVRRAWDIKGSGGVRYDLRTIFLMRAATMLLGPGATSRIRSPRNDGKWICSELAADCWEAGGVPGGRERFVVPADFLKETS